MAESETGDRPSVYPPPHQVLSTMGIDVSWLDDETMVARALVEPELLGRGGRPPGVGALVPIVDLVAGARAGRLAGGDWMATSDAWLHERAPLQGGPIEIHTRVLRAGKRTMVLALEVDGGGRAAVSATVEFSRIRREASSHQATPAAVADGWTRLGSGPLLDRPLEQACGFRVIDAARGEVELARSPFVANSIGTLQGGVVALLGDVAASAVVGPDARTVDLQFRFLAQTGDGPARTHAEIVRRERGLSTVRVEVVDAADGALVGWAVCSVDG